MCRAKRSVFFMAIFLLICSLSMAQFTKEELAEREKWEDFLLTAEIVDQAQPWERGQAVTDPWELTLEKDGIRHKALWKDAKGRMKGSLENWWWEIAAYRLDKLLGLNMVPPTVEKRFRGNRGSCQLYWGKISVRQKIETKVKTPSYKVFPLNRAYFIQRTFDNLICNEDRHQENFRLTDDFRLILIDHSRSFRTSGRYSKRMLYDEKHKQKLMMKELPRELYQKLKELTQASIQEAVGEYLSEKEIEFMLLRRDLIIQWIDKRIKDLGEDKVLYGN
ncbi:hypothetical protein ACFLT9_06265 [Acidobacteriota bacterium]